MVGDCKLSFLQKSMGSKKVAEIYAISRTTLMRWILRFENGGSAAFAVEIGRGRRSRLSAAQKQQAYSWVLQEGATITAKTLQYYIEEQFAIQVSHTTAFRLLKSLGFSYITHRPQHHKQDPEVVPIVRTVLQRSQAIAHWLLLCCLMHHF